MGERLNLIVYLRDREYFFYSGEKKISGVFDSEQDRTLFLKENRVSSVFIVFSKPLIFFRSIEFPFSSLKKVADVVVEESADLFPLPSEQLEFFWYPVSIEKSKTRIYVIGIEKNRIEQWNRLRTTYRFKVSTILEPFLICSYVSKILQSTTFRCIFIDGNYIADYKVQNNVIIESRSMYEEEPASISGIFEETGLPLVCLGDTSKIADVKNCKSINLKKECLSSCIFTILESFPVSSIKRLFKIYPAKTSAVAVNWLFIAGFLLFFLIAGIMFKPVFIAKQVQLELESVEKEMEQTFRSAFPDVKRVVNPLIQARERIRNIGEIQTTIPKVSVLSIMQNISDIIPERISFRVNQMSLRNQDLFLACSTNNLENVEQITQIFKNVKGFESVKVGSIMPESGQITFNLLIRVSVK